jgi:hypothetical protein
MAVGEVDVRTAGGVQPEAGIVAGRVNGRADLVGLAPGFLDRLPAWRVVATAITRPGR